MMRKGIAPSAWVKKPGERPNQITVSLELAKKLKEAGWEKRTVFSWGKCDGLVTAIHQWELDLTAKSINGSWEFIPAPTAEEILSELPMVMHERDEDNELNVLVGTIARWSVSYSAFVDFEDNSLANAAAEMWCYLAENDLLPSKTDE